MKLHLSWIDRGAVTQSVEHWLVEAPAGSTLAQLAEACGVRSEQFSIEGQPIAADAHIGQTPLTSGAQISHGAQPLRPALQGESVLQLTAVAGPDAGRSLPLGPQWRTIGRAVGSDLCLDDAQLSRTHFRIRMSADRVEVEDCDSTNGTQVQGSAVTQARALHVDDVLHAGATTFELRHTPRTLAPPLARHGYSYTTPQTQLLGPLRPVAISYPDAPSAPDKPGFPWLAVVAPLIMAGVLSAIFGPRMLAFALLSPVVGLAGWLSSRRSTARTAQRAQASYDQHQEQAEADLKSAAALFRAHWEQAMPDAEHLLQVARGQSDGRWSRPATGLKLRLGRAAIPASNISVRRGFADQPHPLVPEVPFALPHAGVVGIRGDEVRHPLLAWITAQALAMTSPHDVKVAVITRDPSRWSWLATCPHLLNDSGDPSSGRIVNPDAAPALLAQIAARVEGKNALPVWLLVTDAPDGLAGDESWGRIVRAAADERCLVVSASESRLPVPAGCTATIQLTEERGRYTDAHQEVEFAVEGVGPRWQRALGQAIAPWRDDRPNPNEMEAQRSRSLLELPDLAQQGEWDTWAGQGEMGSLRVPIGMHRDESVIVDLVSDGPHALVAGTTGSGKSELLLTWVAAMAHQYSPEQVTFVLVDYKGGSAFAPLAALPHTVGMVTDLDPASSQRALTSLEAEISRRERLLAEAGAADFVSYHDQAAHPGAKSLPRLVVVVDEFRVLADEQPEVLDRLVRVAAVGRSLGLHLILATQRPAGIITQDIRTNIALRISLRVRDESDSQDVLGTPDAAQLPRECPGAALISTGEGVSPVQVARVTRGSALAVALTAVRFVPGAGAPIGAPVAPESGSTDLDVIQARITQAYERAGMSQPHRPWLPELPDGAEVAKRLGEGRDGWALLDRPDQQAQGPLVFDPFTPEVWAVLGASVSGRTTTLQALAGHILASRPATETHLHVISDQGRHGWDALAADPAFGSLVNAHDREQLGRFVGWWEGAITQRRAEAAQSGFASWREWSAHGGAPAAQVILIDGWDSLGELIDPVKDPVGDYLPSLMRAGLAAGIHIMLTGEARLGSARVSASFTRTLYHRINDAKDAFAADLRQSGIEGFTAGRAVLVHQGESTTLQVALPGPPPERSAVPGHPMPTKVCALPERLTLNDLPSPEDTLVVGIGGTPLAPHGWTHAQAHTALICGPDRSGRTSTLVALAHQLAVGRQVVAIADSSDPRWAEAAETAPGLRILGVHDSDVLASLRANQPRLAVLVDDAHLIEGTEMEPVLRQIAQLAAREDGVIIGAASTIAAGQQIRGLLPDLARTRTGLILMPSQRGDGDAFGIRVDGVQATLPGRGIAISGGRQQWVHAALPPSSTGARPLEAAC